MELRRSWPWLHAAVEDAAYSLIELASEFPPSAVAAVAAINDRHAGNPDFYLYRVIDNPVARLVKLAVIDDDLDPMRVTLLNPMVRRRLLDKTATRGSAVGRRAPVTTQRSSWMARRAIEVSGDVISTTTEIDGGSVGW